LARRDQEHAIARASDDLLSGRLVTCVVLRLARQQVVEGPVQVESMTPTSIRRSMRAQASPAWDIRALRAKYGRLAVKSILNHLQSHWLKGPLMAEKRFCEPNGERLPADFAQKVR